MINPFHLAWGRTLSDTEGDAPRETLPESPIDEVTPEFKVTTHVELQGHGGYVVQSDLARKRKSHAGYVFVQSFKQDSTEAGLSEAKMDVAMRVNEHIRKLKSVPSPEVRYVE